MDHIYSLYTNKYESRPVCDTVGRRLVNPLKGRCINWLHFAIHV